MRSPQSSRPPLRFIGAAAATVRTAAQPPQMQYRGTYPWSRGFCDRPPPPDGRGDGPFVSADGGDGPFVSGDVHLRSVTDANYAMRQGYDGDSRVPQGPPYQHQYRPRPPSFRPHPPHFRPPPPDFHQPPPQQQPYRPLPPGYGTPPLQWYPQHPPPFSRPQQAFRPPFKSADHREWSYAVPQPPPHCEHFTVITYNILADYLARDHRSKLYFHIPVHVLDWEWRKRRLLIEFGLWNPDIMCLQEVDKFYELEVELAKRGYDGIWKMRTGNATDGCAIFWRTNRFQLRHEEHIEFNKLGLRDNVAQICVLESRIPGSVENASIPLSSSSGQPGVNQVVVCNIHVLYNPKRGEIKLGQVRVLLDRAYAVSRVWNDAPVVICGDFNSTPKSPLYNFLLEQKLSLSGLARDRVSGQYSASTYEPRPRVSSGFHSAQPFIDKSSELAKNVEQCGNGIGSHTSESQNCKKNSSLTEMVSPSYRSTGLQEMSTNSRQSSLDGPCTTTNDTVSDITAKEKIETDKITGTHPSNSSSSQCADGDNSKGTVESCNAQTGISLNLGDDKELIRASSTFGDTCFWEEGEGTLCDGKSRNLNHIALDEGTVCDGKSSNLNHFALDEHCPLSESDICNQTIDKLELHPLHQKIAYYSDKVECTSEPNTKLSIVPIFKENCESLLSNRASEDGVIADATLNSKLIDDIAIEPVNMESPIPERTGNSEVDLTPESKDGFGISCTSTCNSDLSDLSDHSSPFHDLNSVEGSHGKSGKVEVQDANCDIDHGTMSATGDIRPLMGREVGSLDIHCSNQSIEPNSEEGCQVPEKPASVNGINICQLEGPVNVGKGENVVDDSHNLEETSDPDFFKELLGKDVACEYQEDIKPLPSSVSSQSSSAHEILSSSGSDAAFQVTHPYIPYNPFLWTPMEIEIASGNAKNTFIEHNLKLRSAYTDVEDYAGTKDSSGEPQVTSYNRLFMGTVDYMWYSEGVQTVKVLNTIPKHILRRTPGFPTQKWGSDHIALACEFAFTKGLSNK